MAKDVRIGNKYTLVVNIVVTFISSLR